MRRWLTAALMALCGAWAWATPDAEGAFRLRVGPFFEYGSREGRGMTRLAVRPFFAWEEDRRNPPDRDMEVVWPLSHFGWRGDAFHWRVVMTFWNDEDRTDRLTRDYSLAIPPLWVNGRDGEDAYWGLFPIWGRMPKFLLLEDFRWRLFPLWLSYRTGGTQGVGRTYVLWPFFSLKHDDDAARWGLWPLYGTKRERERDSRYVLWPFWNDQTFHAPNHNGGAWMLWPLAERIDADTEQGWGLLPPLFRWSETTDGAFLLRCPWPLFERYRDRRESTWRAWRFWGMTHRGTRDGWWFLHPIVVSERQRTENRFVRRFRVWPFYVDEETVAYDIRGRARTQHRHFRVWPFYASDWHEGEGLRRRALALFPIREVPAVERNWAPFWTLYTATREPGSGEVLHELFWGLIWWRTHPGADETEEGQAHDAHP